MKTVGILIVTFNRLNLLQEEIFSIRNQTYKDFQIIVVDNSSTDGTADWLAQQRDIITITQENLGGAGGFYTGLKYITENKYKYCWLMDDDVECTSTSLQELVSAAQQYPNSGFFCSRVFGKDGSLMNVPSIDDRIIENKYSCWLEKIDECMIKVKSATFVSVLIPIDRVIEIGLPIKEFFIWGDDSEYTKRLSSVAECFLVYKSIVIHKRNSQQTLDFMTESNPARLNNYFYLLRNMFYNVRKYDKPKDLFILSLYVISLFIKSLIKFDIKRIKVLLRVFWAIFTFSPKIRYANYKE